MARPNPIASKAVDAALLIDAKLASLQGLLVLHRTARIKQAQQEGTMNTDGLLDRLESEYAILSTFEDVFGIDLSDARTDIANEARDECGYDLREDCYVSGGDA